MYSHSRCAKPNSWDRQGHGKPGTNASAQGLARQGTRLASTTGQKHRPQCPAEPCRPPHTPHYTSPFISSPASSRRLRETEISPGLSQRRARIAVWAVCLLSCSHCSGSHHNVDFCQRDGPASHLSHSALIIFDQLRLESSFNPFWGEIA